MDLPSDLQTLLETTFYQESIALQEGIREGLPSLATLFTAYCTGLNEVHVQCVVQQEGVGNVSYLRDLLATTNTLFYAGIGRVLALAQEDFPTSKQRALEVFKIEEQYLLEKTAHMFAPTTS